MRACTPVLRGESTCSIPNPATTLSKCPDRTLLTLAFLFLHHCVLQPLKLQHDRKRKPMQGERQRRRQPSVLGEILTNGPERKVCPFLRPPPIALLLLFA